MSLGLDWYGRFSAFTAFEVWDLVLVVLALMTIVALAIALGLLHTHFGPEPGWRSGRPR